MLVQGKHGKTSLSQLFTGMLNYRLVGYGNFLGDGLCVEVACSDENNNYFNSMILERVTAM